MLYHTVSVITSSPCWSEWTEQMVRWLGRSDYSMLSIWWLHTLLCRKAEAQGAARSIPKKKGTHPIGNSRGVATWVWTTSVRFRQGIGHLVSVTWVRCLRWEDVDESIEVVLDKKGWRWKREDESLSALTARVEQPMLEIKELRPADAKKPFTIDDLDDELICITLLCSLPKEYSHFIPSLLLLSTMDKDTLKSAVITEDINRQPRADAATTSGNSALATSTPRACGCPTTTPVTSVRSLATVSTCAMLDHPPRTPIRPPEVREKARRLRKHPLLPLHRPIPLQHSLLPLLVQMLVLLLILRAVTMHVFVLLVLVISTSSYYPISSYLSLPYLPSTCCNFIALL